MNSQLYSVLMSVYYKENPDFLRTSMDSIWKQTIPTDDFVLVCDGPLNDDLNRVIEEMERQYPKAFHVVRIANNVGLGKALNYGIKFCKYNLVARMDSDDISRPDRCEKQLKVFFSRPDVSIVSGIVQEFTDEPGCIDAERILPETHKDIVEFAKKRNPFNHPCVMYKKDAVTIAGGYQDFFLLEDYYLWVRMIQKGFIGYNLQEPLLWMRAGSEMYKRRAGWEYAKSQKALFKYMKESEFIGTGQYVRSVAIRTLSSVMPNKLREFLFKTVMRNR